MASLGMPTLLAARGSGTSSRRGFRITPLQLEEEANIEDSGILQFPDFSVKNTFISAIPQLSPSLAAFYSGREVRTCPSKHAGRLERGLQDFGSVSTTSPRLTPSGEVFYGEASSAGLPTTDEASSQMYWPETPFEDPTTVVGARSVCLEPGTPARVGTFPPSPAAAQGLDAEPEKIEPSRRLVLSLTSALVYQDRHAEADSLSSRSSAVSGHVEHGEGDAYVVFGSRLAMPASIPSALPSEGSVGHDTGVCKPCAFFHTKGCETGVKCQFCHLCGPEERKLRRKKKEDAKKAARQVRQAKKNARSGM